MAKTILLFTALTLCSFSFADEEALPSRLQSLQEGYERKLEEYRTQLEQQTGRLNETYRQELEKLKASHLKSGNLEEAVAVEEELKRFSTTERIDELFAAIVGEWTWSSGNAFSITEEREVISHKGTAGKVVLIDLEKSTIGFDWGGDDYELTVAEDRRSMFGIEIKTNNRYTARKQLDEKA